MSVASSCYNPPSINTSAYTHTKPCALQNRPSDAELLTYTMTVQTQCFSFEFKFYIQLAMNQFKTPLRHKGLVRPWSLTESSASVVLTTPSLVLTAAPPRSLLLWREPTTIIQTFTQSHLKMITITWIVQNYFIRWAHVTVEYLPPPLLLLLQETKPLSSLSFRSTLYKPPSPQSCESFGLTFSFMKQEYLRRGGRVEWRVKS